MSTTGKVGLTDRSRDLQLFTISQIFGHSTNGNIVPNPGNFVFDPVQGIFIVVDVDYVTGVSVLKQWQIPKQNNADSEEGLILATGPGSVTESFRFLVDKSVTPYVGSPDTRLRFYGDDVSHYAIFKGTEYGEKGKIISFVHDTAGNVQGEMAPFKRGIEYIDGKPVISNLITPCLLTEDLKDGDRVTIVVYNGEGVKVGTAVLPVLNTGAVRQLDSARRYVRGIELQSEFIYSSQPDILKVPVNIPVEHIPMVGVVHYSDGQKEVYPIDQNRMSLYGMDNYTATSAGEGFDLTLCYKLADSEVSYEQKPTTDRKVVRGYRALTVTADGAYSVHLFVYPQWNNETRQYYLDYWLYNMDRQTFYNVSSLIELGVNSAAFDPNRYSSVQTVTVAIDLNRVNSQFKSVRHVQTFQVILMSRGSENKPNWAMKPRPDQQSSFGGNGIEARFKQLNVNDWEVNIANEATSRETWIQKLYYDVEPLYDPNLADRAPYPTHFRLRFQRNVYEYSVDQWNQTFNVVNDLQQGELLYIEWIRRTDNTDLQLAITGLPMHNYTTT